MDDTISREDAINALWKALYEYEDNTEKQFIESDELDVGDWIVHRIFVQNMSDIDRHTILNLPSAQQWIPCSKNLPENGRQVLVYARSVHYALAKYDEMREADGTYKMHWVTFDAWKPFYDIKDVIAWCELPEPYREEQDGNT